MHADFAFNVKKRVFSVIGWTAGAFIVTGVGIGFVSGILFIFLAMSEDKSETVPQFVR